ncbi:D-ribose pyranase [Clostridium sediminicola]|uniref:D-ribose pyranase n=1 Tax=Clostridium sediminicola TaxID=3114879 RepID=UPI0031F263F0
MKKGKLLNSEITTIISKMGHTDSICIGDCGLPIPEETKRIDISLCAGIPTFLDTLKVILEELKIEEVILAKEIEEMSPNILVNIKEIIGDIKVTFTTHEDFKNLTKKCKAVVRTGEQTPYANIILKSGVVF